MAKTISCPYCGKLTDPNLNNCVHCGGFVKKGDESQEKKPDGRSQTCPSCGALVREGDIICVACGTNLLTGQKIAEEKALPRPEVPRTVPWALIGAGVAVVVVVVLAATALFLLLQDPVGKALAMYAEGRKSEAVALLEDHVAKHPNEGRAQLELGKMRWQEGDFDRAATAFEQAFWGSEDRDAALMALLSRAQRDTEQSRDRQVAILEGLVRQDGADHQARFLLALVRGANGDTEGQIQALNEVVKITGPTQDLRKALGASLALEGEYEEAAHELRAALHDSPEDGDVMTLMGVIANLQGDADESVKTLRGALGAAPSARQEALTQLGLLLVGRGQFADADGYLSEAVSMDRPSPAAQFFYGVCLRALGRTQSAIREFEAVLRGTSPYAGPAALEAAQAHLSLDKRDTASNSLDTAVAKGNVSEAAVETLRGRIAALDGDEQAAREAFRRAISADPGYAPARLENGLWHIRNNVVSEGVRELEQYLTMVSPEDVGTRTEEVKAFLNQLRESMGGGANPAAQAVAQPGRGVS